MTIVLASASPARRALLAAAGLELVVDPAAVDEAELKSSLAAEGAGPGEIAEALAELKASRVSARHPGRLVIGADQILECDGVRFDKPRDAAEARAQLASLRGRVHELVAAIAVVRDGALGAQKPKQGDQRQAKDREIVAVNPLEQLRAQAFERVATDRVAERGTHRGTIVVEEGVAEPPHREARILDMTPQQRAIPDHRDCRDQFVNAAAQ